MMLMELLKEFSDLIELHEEGWSAAGVASSVDIGPSREKSGMWLRLSYRAAGGEIILWNTGEAEMSWTADGESFQQEHYDVTSAVGLKGCLRDLEVRLGMVAD
jgi:hypothetical protein